MAAVLGPTASGLPDKIHGEWETVPLGIRQTFDEGSAKGSDEASPENQAPPSTVIRRRKKDRSSKWKICLTMIVKNEGKIIWRLLDSVYSIIDSICITDTGSTDDTVERIKTWGTWANIPTTVCVSEFRDFSYARNASLANAQKLYPKAHFLLLVDADFDIRIEGFMKSKLDLKTHKYSISQKFTGVERIWHNTRIVANWVNWEYHLRTHEYITASDRQTTYQGEIKDCHLDSIWINDIADGGSKERKHERDQELLTQDVEDPLLNDHDRARAYYYLATSLRDGGKIVESIPWFKKRIAAGGWYEERYMCYQYIGECYQMLYEIAAEYVKIMQKRENVTANTSVIVSAVSQYLKESVVTAHVAVPEKELTLLKKYHLDNKTLAEMIAIRDDHFRSAVGSYIDGFLFCSIRAESVYGAVKLLRVRGDESKGDLTSGLTLALEGRKIPVPQQCTLNVDIGIHKYGFDNEIMFFAYYLPDRKEIGQAAKDRLEKQVGEMPSYYLTWYNSNKQFYN